MIHERSAESGGAQGRGPFQRLGRRQMAVPAAVAPGPENVIERHPRLVERTRRDRAAIERKEQRLEAHKVRRQSEQARSFGEGFANQVEPKLLEIAEAAVDKPR